MNRFAGVDGCRAGWVVVTVDERGRQAEVAVMAFSDVVRQVEAGTLVCAAVDMPIGLAERERRACDTEARRRLGPRRSSVFPSPVRAALGAATYAEAAARSRAACGRSLPIQTFNLLKAIAEVDQAMRPALQDRVVEAHPELAFAGLLGHPAVYPKRSAGGHQERVAALGDVVVGVDALLAQRPAGVAADDLLDACALTWTARRLAQGRAERLGDGAVDARGLRMEVAA